MTVFAQLVVSALGFGGIYALAALGLTIVFKTSNVVNFAYGATATVVAVVGQPAVPADAAPDAGIAWS